MKRENLDISIRVLLFFKATFAWRAMEKSETLFFYLENGECDIEAKNKYLIFYFSIRFSQSRTPLSLIELIPDGIRQCLKIP